MAQGKVEICGVNTARLPLLKTAEKEALLKNHAGGHLCQGKIYRREPASCPQRDQAFFIQQRKCR